MAAYPDFMIWILRSRRAIFSALEISGVFGGHDFSIPKYTEVNAEVPIPPAKKVGYPALFSSEEPSSD